MVESSEWKLEVTPGDNKENDERKWKGIESMSGDMGSKKTSGDRNN